jgi:hypothetical protein
VLDQFAWPKSPADALCLATRVKIEARDRFDRFDFAQGKTFAQGRFSIAMVRPLPE